MMTRYNNKISILKADVYEFYFLFLQSLLTKSATKYYQIGEQGSYAFQDYQV